MDSKDKIVRTVQQSIRFIEGHNPVFSDLLQNVKQSGHVLTQFFDSLCVDETDSKVAGFVPKSILNKVQEMKSVIQEEVKSILLSLIGSFRK